MRDHAFSRLCLHVAVSLFLGTRFQHWRFLRHESGRPILANRHLRDKIHLSVSHCDELVAVAVSRVGRIGIDVEPQHRQISESILRRICSLTPADIFSHHGRIPSNIKLWTAAEAAGKMRGMGISQGTNLDARTYCATHLTWRTLAHRGKTYCLAVAQDYHTV